MNTTLLSNHDNFDGLVVEFGSNVSVCRSVDESNSLPSSGTTAQLPLSENRQTTSSLERISRDLDNRESCESSSSCSSSSSSSSSSSRSSSSSSSIGGDMNYDNDSRTKSSSGCSSAQSVTSSFWSLLSNVLFLIGSALSVCLACWDVKADEDSYDDDDYYSYDDDIGTPSTKVWTHYHTLSAVSALMLIGNSIVDIVWSLRDAKYSRGNRQHSWQIAAALAFGIAACSDLASVFMTNNENPNPAYTATTISVHFYLLNAILSIVSEGQSCAYLSATLTTWGDLLFLVASIIDLVLNYIGYPSASDGTWHAVDIANLVSSLLWLVDAIFYITSDVLEIRDYYDDDISECTSVEESSPDQYVLLLNDSFELTATP